MQPTITLPRGYGIPKFYVGQRTQQGKIIGIEVLPHDSVLAENCSSGYRYLVMVSRYLYLAPGNLDVNSMTKCQVSQAFNVL
ncbi:hypothetical protein LC613_36620 [Nostoc sphaeroides CHAB 2801]|uniref:hypothetical protein n=1 Tax=Nostoc sphaeroides TaxID=446679 RepID=UPI001E4FAD25|nr:hypothetical protein [Nostoc sphaeroides]MCC5633050.1 hypothetical protein [Nostoc sphaeroides CHAB 2801]